MNFVIHWNETALSYHLFFLSSASVRSILFLSFFCGHLCMKCSLSISNFLEEIASLSHSIFSSISLHCSLRKALLSLLAVLWNSVQVGILFLYPFAFCFFSQLFVKLPQVTILPFFFLGMVLITASCTMLWTFIHSSSGTLSDLIP